MRIALVISIASSSRSLLHNSNASTALKALESRNAQFGSGTAIFGVGKRINSLSNRETKTILPHSFAMQSKSENLFNFVEKAKRVMEFGGKRGRLRLRPLQTARSTYFAVIDGMPSGEVSLHIHSFVWLTKMYQKTSICSWNGCHYKKRENVENYSYAHRVLRRKILRSIRRIY